MALGRTKAELVVRAAEREVLEQWARRPKTAQALAQRARIVLACATGAANTAVAVRVGVTPQMVGKWRARYVTPTGASWLNLVERWFALLTEKQLRRGVHRRTREFEAAIKRYLALTNDAPKPFVWTKTADEILESVARFCRRTSGSGH